MTDKPNIQYREIDLKAVLAELEAAVPEVQAHVAALEKAGRRPSQKTMNEFEVTI